jgi:hypothetical protein
VYFVRYQGNKTETRETLETNNAVTVPVCCEECFQKILLKKCKPGHQMVICSLLRSQMMKLTNQSKVRLLKIPTVRSKAYM